ILASSSPRRRELLSLFEIPFEVRPAHIDETPRPNEPPKEYVQRLAREKAESLITNYKLQNDVKSNWELVIAADTTVTIDNEIIGKPGDAVEAVEMLKKLRGRTHQVCTAITVSNLETGESIHELCSSDVPMRNFSDEEMGAYVASGDPLDKAGGYAIQHNGFHPVENFSHCYASVMGLPLCHLTRALRKFKVELSVDVPSKCQQFNNYQCPVYREILAL
ncbi:MAG: septum formation protein Maf, partial [Chloroflexi bacterium]|nr:septum formation protein Maf [Chloroflexota bacterium]